MKIVKRYYIPGETITLYDFSIHKNIRGILYIYRRHNALNINYQRLALVCFSLAIIGYLVILAPVLLMEIKYQSSYLSAIIPKVFQKQTTNLAVQNISTIQQNQPKSIDYLNITEYIISIPRVNLSATIVPNVNANNEVEYQEKLKEGVAHAKNSAFPGQDGTTYLFAHSTDSIINIRQYNAEFYALKDLEPGDEINIKLNNVIFKYEVSSKQIVNPEDLDALENTESNLILSTCWPPGTNWQRLIVYAKSK